MKIQRLSGSVRQIAEGLSVDRSILSRIVKERGIKPANAKGAHPTYYVRDIAEAIRDVDPAREGPFQQLARAKAARERLKLQQEAGRLCPVDEVHDGYAAQAKLFAEMASTLPDLLERDVGLPAAAIARAERAIDQFRVEVHRQLMALTGTDSPTAPKESNHA